MFTGNLDIGSVSPLLASTGDFDSWTGSMLEIGPLYPFVGWEVILWIVGMALWILWHVWQGRFENRTYNEDEAKYKGEELLKAMRGDGP